MRLLFLCAFVCGCVESVPPKAVGTITGCQEACDQLAELKCPEGDNVDKCLAACEDVAQAGYIWTTESTGPLCIVKAETVLDVRACNVRCGR